MCVRARYTYIKRNGFVTLVLQEVAHVCTLQSILMVLDNFTAGKFCHAVFSPDGNFAARNFR